MTACTHRNVNCYMSAANPHHRHYSSAMADVVAESVYECKDCGRIVSLEDRLLGIRADLNTILGSE